MASQAAIGLALLKVSWDENRTDYITNFIPLIAECARLSSNEVISANELTEDVYKTFGLRIPINVVETIIKRARREGFFDFDQRKHIYLANREKLDKLDFYKIQQKVIQQHEELVRSLLSFAENEMKEKWTEKQAEEALLAYLDDFQLSSLSKDNVPGIVPVPKTVSTGTHFVVGMFIRHIFKNNLRELEYLENVLKGNFLANAIFLPDASRATKSFKKTDVYLDTTFLIHALGYAGATRADPCVELLNLVYESGGDLKCFTHTLAEIKGALEAIAVSISRSRSQPISGPIVPSVEFFLGEEATESDILRKISTLEQDLKTLRISVVEKPEYVEEFVIDERALREHLHKNMNYANQRALDRDVDSISAIQRIREWGEYVFIEESRAIFVTSNAGLARFSTDFFYGRFNPGAIPPVITDNMLTTLLWLKRPVQAPDLPRKRIIADYFAAVQPSDRLWVKYQHEISALEKDREISIDEYYLLRHTIQAKTALMELTHGEELAFTRGSVREILKLAKEKIGAEYGEKLGDAVQAREIAEGKATAATARVTRSLETTRSSANRIGKVARNLAAVVFGIGLSVAVFYTFPWQQLNENGQQNNGLLFLCLITLAVITLADAISGTTVQSVLRSIEVYVSKKAEVTLRGITGLEEE